MHYVRLLLLSIANQSHQTWVIELWMKYHTLAVFAAPSPEFWMFFDQTARLPRTLRFFVDSRGHGMFRKAASASSVASFLMVFVPSMDA